MSSKESNLWYNAMKDKMDSMASNQKNSQGNIKRHKARLVAKGFTQTEGINYTKTFSPVSKKDSFRVIMTLVVHFDFDLHQMDVKITFLNGDQEEEIYMKQPEGFSLQA
ncbi:Copia protein, partial [Mucuna pruriens]